MGAKPVNVINTKGYNNKPFVKIATSNLYIEPNQIDPIYLTNLSFEEVGSKEFINSVSNNLILNSNYSNYSNISQILDKYSSYNVLPMSDNINTILLNKHEIDFNSHVPAFGKGTETNLIDLFSNLNGYSGICVYLDQNSFTQFSNGTLSAASGAAAPYTGTITGMVSTSGLNTGDYLYLATSSTTGFYAQVTSVASSSITISSTVSFSSSIPTINKIPNPQNIVIDVVNIDKNYSVEVEFLTTVEPIDDTI
jgi:hypothetical protein